MYQPTDTKLKRQLAIKILPASLAADPERMARFQREAEVLVSLNHPNIADDTFTVIDELSGYDALYQTGRIVEIGYQKVHLVAHQHVPRVI